MDLELTDRVIIVTGASAGIGRATVELLAAEGAHVVGAARKPDDLDGPRVSAVTIDLTTPDGPEDLIARRSTVTAGLTGSSTTSAESPLAAGSSTSPTMPGVAHLNSTC